jgi:hypothetical protein
MGKLLEFLELELIVENNCSQGWVVEFCFHS